ncbi:hypothetical protein D8763_20450, partial [Proteus mirabilis]|nr:hypothetical protein [Proteus mirabilis]
FLLLLFSLPLENGKSLSFSSTFCASSNFVMSLLSNGREEEEKRKHRGGVVGETCRLELAVEETYKLVQDDTVLVKDSMASLVVVVTCKLELVVAGTCKLGYMEDSMASWVVVVTCKRELVVVATCKPGYVGDSMASWVVVVTCKRELVV